MSTLEAALLQRIYIFLPIITSVDLTIATTLSPSCKRSDSEASLVITDVICCPPGKSMITSVMTPPCLIDRTVPCNWLRALISIIHRSFLALLGSVGTSLCKLSLFRCSQSPLDRGSSLFITWGGLLLTPGSERH